MKSIKIFTVILMLSFSGIAYGQFTWGDKFGANFSNMAMKGNYETDVDLKSKLGLNIGLYGEYAFNEKISLQLALMFVDQKGAKYETDGVKYKMAIDYFELQPNLIYNLKAGKIPLFIAIGPYFSFLGNGTLKANKAVLGPDGDSKTESINLGNDKENDLMKASDFGLNIAAGVSMKDWGRIGLQYGLGIANLALVTDNDSSIKNRSFSLFWSYPFNLGKKKK